MFEPKRTQFGTGGLILGFIIAGTVIHQLTKKTGETDRLRSLYNAKVRENNRLRG